MSRNHLSKEGKTLSIYFIWYRHRFVSCIARSYV